MDNIKNNDSWGKYIIWACILVVVIMAIAYMTISYSFPKMDE